MTARALTRRILGQRTLLAMVGIGLLGCREAAASPLAAPTERVLLTVSGKITNTNAGDTAQFDRPMLEALGMQTIETHTPWYNDVSRFEGPRISALLDAVGATGDKVMALALNDYATEIPLSDFREFGTILALKRDGNYITVRDKGPLFVVYPYDSNPELKQQKYYGRSAWQVAKFVIK
jgi:hypothetical protein